jgi:serine/threonine-protein kinase
MARLVGPLPSAGMPLLASPANENGAAVSADGRWLAYQSDESGRNEIYVRPFPSVDKGHWQVSTAGGTRPLWSRDGRELLYLEARGVMLAVMAVSVNGGSSFAAGAPTLLFQGAYLARQVGRPVYDISLDGKRFLMIKNAEADGEGPPLQLVVVQNWTEELKRLVPIK